MAHPTIDGNGVRLRPTTEQDLETLRRFFTDPGFYEGWGGHRESDAEICAKYLGERSPSVECFVVEEEGRPIGLVQYHVADDGGEGGGMDLVLLPAARGRGIGSEVVRAVVGFVKGDLGWRRFTVDPDVSNTRGINFWRRVGFRPARIIDDPHEREPYWLMEWPD